MSADGSAEFMCYMNSLSQQARTDVPFFSW